MCKLGLCNFIIFGLILLLQGQVVTAVLAAPVDNLEAQIEVQQEEQEDQYNAAVAELKQEGEGFTLSVEKFTKLANDVAATRESRAVANLLLGDLYAGLLPVSHHYPGVDLRRAYNHYIKVDEAISGLSRAQFMLGYLHLHHPEVVDKKEAKETDIESLDVPVGLLYYIFAAEGNSTEAQASLAYSVFTGTHAKKSCPKSAELYRRAAQTALKSYEMKPSIKVTHDNIKLRDEYEAGRSSLDEEEDYIYYISYNADNGALDSLVAMGTLYLEGGSGIEVSPEKALQHFKRAAATQDANALEYLAYMHTKGLGTPINNQTAIELLEKASRRGNSKATTRLALMYLHGWGVDKDVPHAIKLLEAASAEKESWAQLQLGRLHFTGSESGEIKMSHATARTYFQNSAQHGNLIAIYNLGILTLNGYGVPASCPTALSYFKNIVEHTVLSKAVVGAYREYALGNYQRALVRYEIVASMGSSVAQENTAWMYEFDVGTNILGISSKNTNSHELPSAPTETTKPEESTPQKEIAEEELEAEPQILLQGPKPDISIMAQEQRYQKAMHWYKASAVQHSAYAHLKLGDFYYYGRGTPPDPAVAVVHYQHASDLRDAQATFNLGWMHHVGVGLPQDLHLAKRYYDLAMEQSPDEAYFPSMILLGYLWITNHLTYLQGGGTLLGLEWESFALAVLGVFLFVALGIRYLVLLELQANP